MQTYEEFREQVDREMYPEIYKSENPPIVVFDAKIEALKPKIISSQELKPAA